MSLEDEREQAKVVRDLAAQQGWDMRPYETALKIREAIRPIVDKDKGIDSGTSDEQADLFVWLDGVEYHIAVTLSGAQRRNEAN